MSLSARLKHDTAALHRAAESTGAMRLLLQGRLGRHSYRTLLQALQAIYAGLEAGLEAHASHPLLVPIHLPGLARGARLAQDLRAFGHEPSAASQVPAAAARRYARRLRLLARWYPALLAAHAYVRYLGDLHGGQTLRAVVQRSFALGDGPGTAFYEFGSRVEVQALIAHFRHGLQLIEQRAPTLGDLLVREAQAAFALHIRLFTEIAASPTDRAHRDRPE